MIRTEVISYDLRGCWRVAPPTPHWLRAYRKGDPFLPQVTPPIEIHLKHEAVTTTITRDQHFPHQFLTRNKMARKTDPLQYTITSVDNLLTFSSPFMAKKGDPP
ncbi:hypothetical protein TIFTF001_024548 [Ficus carica]|uniref:Uncharacterized protein n=1 Tax=Ficus carica TaxID=3494 RepID=A0AA88DDD6_FICCA|nr:hypothetical protein TIFTF001_024548 [Ficus carica]